MNLSNNLIAVLRRGSTDSSHILTWLEYAGYKCVDIFKCQDVELFDIDDTGTCRVLLAGISVQSFFAIIVLGTPGTYSNSTLKDRDLWYRNAERTSALLSALTLTTIPRIINAGLVFLWNRQLVDKGLMLRRLNSCGWRIPESIQYFDLDNNYENDLSRSVHSHRTPEPNLETHQLVVFTSSGLSVFVYDQEFSPQEEITFRSDATIQMLRNLKLDWLTIAIGEFNGLTFAYGAKIELPRSLSKDIAAKIINSIL